MLERKTRKLEKEMSYNSKANSNCPRRKERKSQNNVKQSSSNSTSIFTCTIAGVENPNISKPSRLPGGCRGGRFILPNLCCFVISWFTLSLTISQHFAAETWINTSLGQCSNETWKLNESVCHAISTKNNSMVHNSLLNLFSQAFQTNCLPNKDKRKENSPLLNLFP